MLTLRTDTRFIYYRRLIFGLSEATVTQTEGVEKILRESNFKGEANSAYKSSSNLNSSPAPLPQYLENAARKRC